jgi:hypothetical protein
LIGVQIKNGRLRLVDNRLAYIDQASFLGLRALARKPLVQCTWIYERVVDMDRLYRFRGNLGYGLLGRRIERSPLPFARHRWVSWRGPGDIDIAETPRRRAGVTAWVDERASVPIDPELGPSWHLGVLPIEDNGTAVSLVVSHSVADSLGICLAIADAVEGRTPDLGYPPPGSRTRGRALLQDSRETAGAVPEMARALIGAVRVARRNRQALASSIASAPRSPLAAGGEAAAVVPSLTAYVDLSEWDARAKSLGGTSNSLFAGFASRLGVRAGRIRDDGAVTLSFPVSERTENDSRGNALTSAVVTVDPTHVMSDLSGIRIKIKQALVGLAEKPNELLTPLPLTPLMPKRLARRLAGMALSTADLPIGCSNIGDMDPAVNRPDGTEADYFSMRLIDPGIKKSSLERMGGQLFLLSGRVHGKVFVTVFAYRVGRENSKNELRDVVSRALEDFTLSAMID